MKLYGATEGCAQLVGFQLAKRSLTVAFKKFGDGDAASFLNALVKIDEAPAELAGEASADSAFTRAHETGEADDRDA